MTLKVVRNPDGTLDVSYNGGGASFWAYSQKGSFVDNLAAEPAASTADATPAAAPQAAALQPADASGDAEAAPADQAASAAPAAPSDQPANAAPYKCPQCGAGYDSTGTCANQHAPVRVQPTAEVVGEQAATPAAPAWPDGSSAGSS